MIRSVSFTVHGKAIPAGSKRPMMNPRTGKGFVKDMGGAAGAAWREDVRHQAWLVMLDKFGINDPHDGPCILHCTFYRERPASHYGTKGLNAKGRSMPYPTTRPDLGKLIRNVEDGLTGIVWKDDSQVISYGRSAKAWGSPARAEITVEFIDVAAMASEEPCAA